MTRAWPALPILLLSGCVAGNANVSSEWDCPAQEGKACTSIEDADAEISAAGPPISLLPPAAVPAEVASLLPEAARSGAAANPAGTDAPIKADPAGYDPRRVRAREVLARVWFYPFVDGGGHYHEGGFVHVVMRPAGWQTAPEHMFPAASAPMEKAAPAPRTDEAAP
ncbi:MAG: TraV family lipoprotein [Alphaproteobacteria bacterium]|nr:TraV family lipoprotein [Alphaproteobacteria bacterium]